MSGCLSTYIFCDGFSSQCPRISQKSDIRVNGSTGPLRQNWCFANMAQIPRPHAMLKENRIRPLWVSFDLVAFLSHHQLPKDMIQGSLDGKRSLSKIRTFETLLGRSDSAEGSQYSLRIVLTDQAGRTCKHEVKYHRSKHTNRYPHSCARDLKNWIVTAYTPNCSRVLN